MKLFVSLRGLTPEIYTRDTLGRVKTVTRGGNNHAEYVYNPGNLLLTTEKLNMDLQERHLHRHYDPIGRARSIELTTSTGTSQYSSGYGYDTGGRLDRVWHHPTLDSVTKSPLGNPTFTYGYTYTQSGIGALRVGASTGQNLKQDFMPYTLTRSATDPTHILTANRTYQGTRDALHSIENKAGTTLVSGYTYAVNSLGQRDTVTTSGRDFTGVPAHWSWFYDSLGQVRLADSPTAARDRAYQFDEIGNRKKFAHGTTVLPTNDNYTSNALNQYSLIPNFTPQPVHDLDGNLTHGPVPGTNGNAPGVTAPADATEIKWDAENRMVSCKIGTIIYYYGYDHLSRQMGRGETTALNRRYYYDGWNRIAEYTTLWAAHNTFTWGLDLSGTMQGAGGVGGLLVTRWVSESGQPDYFTTYDGNGNVSEYLGTAGENIVHYEYDPFGGLTRLTGNNSGRFQYRFSTKPRDFSTGLYNYTYRWYDPFMERWQSKDPIGEEGGLNLYGFVGNEPIWHIDVLGLAKKPCPFDVTGGHAGDPDEPGNVDSREKNFNRNSKNCNSGRFYGASCYRSPDGGLVWPTPESRDNDPRARPSNSTIGEEVRRQIRQAEADAPAECDDKKKCCSKIELKVTCLQDSDDPVSGSMAIARKNDPLAKRACNYSNTYKCPNSNGNGGGWENRLFDQGE